jgi:hypothetical protein
MARARLAFVVLSLVVGLTGCVRTRWLVPPEGGACWRECMLLGIACDSTGDSRDSSNVWHRLGCRNRENTCVSTCPGAYEAEE